MDARLHTDPHYEEELKGLHLRILEMGGFVEKQIANAVLALVERDDTLARLLAVEPEVILMDEPCSALDPIATAKIEELMLELRKRYTIVIVTHNMQQAARVSDFTAFLYLGQLVEFGETEQIFTNPQQKETEDYITGRFG